MLYAGKLCQLGYQWHVPLDATAAFTRVARGGQQTFVHSGSWIPN